MIKPQNSRYWIVGVILFPHLIFLLKFIIFQNVDMVFFTASFIVLAPVVLGALMRSMLAYHFIQACVIISFIMLPFAIGFSGDTGIESAMGAFFIFLAFGLVFSYLNGLFKKDIENKNK